MLIKMYNNESIYTKSQSWWTRQNRRSKTCNNIRSFKTRN